MASEAAFTISRHALKRMRQRGITTAQIRRVLSNPDFVEVDAEDVMALHAVKRLYIRGGSIFLRVVYNRRAEPPRVITAFFDRRLRRGR